MTEPLARNAADVGEGGAVTRVLVVGSAGQLGTAMLRRMPPDGGRRIELRGVARADLDVTDEAAVMAHPALTGVDVVVNAAAWTDVDGAETPEGEAAAHAVNAVAPGLLARRCAREGSHLVHVSTDYVFGEGAGARPAEGEPSGRRPLRPGDPTAPDTAYGRTKLAGERAVLEAAAGAGATIVRTAWVYSGPTQPDAPDFVSTMLRLEERGRPDGTIDVVDDQHGNPTFVDDLADALWELVLRPVPGVFHVTGAGRATWHELASEVFAVVAKQRGGDAAEVAAAIEAARTRVRPCASEQFPRPAKRPEWSVLDGSAWVAAGFAPLPDWRDGVRRALGAAE